VKAPVRVEPLDDGAPPTLTREQIDATIRDNLIGLRQCLH
jgi:hypothetical protein